MSGLWCRTCWPEQQRLKGLKVPIAGWGVGIVIRKEGIDLRLSGMLTCFLFGFSRRYLGAFKV